MLRIYRGIRYSDQGRRRQKGVYRPHSQSRCGDVYRWRPVKAEFSYFSAAQSFWAVVILKTRYEKEKLVIAGTSAGAAAASTNMIYRGQSNKALIKGEVQITAGLGFIDSVIIDTHFVQRGRIGRLLYAVASNPGMLGIGLGEDAGLLITEGTMMEAIGSGLTILVNGRKNGRNQYL